MKRRYVTTDVFTDRMFGGNPLAVVLDAEGLSSIEMQAIALEFNYSETTFVLPPDDPANTAKVRIFTPRTEVPFAGHPNVGTAFVLAHESPFAAAAAASADGIFLFEERAGLVPLKLLREHGATVGAEPSVPAIPANAPSSRGAYIKASTWVGRVCCSGALRLMMER
jgi:trans-2,3-dihydro-3-hydroxyanthranilate isomerase